MRRHKGTLYAATESGVYYLDRQAKSFRPVPGLIGNKQAFGFLNLGDVLLSATNGGLYAIDGGRAATIRPIRGVIFRSWRYTARVRIRTACSQVSATAWPR